MIPTARPVLWNALVAPLAGLPVAGVIWYQGESNVVRATQYRTLFPLMIRGWRTAWSDPKLPFLFVQLPNFDEAGPKAPLGESAWADLREAQALALREPRTAMAVTLDIGDGHDIHPREKQEVGRRLALAALKMVYAREVIASGPTFAAAVRDGAAIKVRFTNVAGGLTTSDGAPPRGFLIGGRGPRLEAGRGAHRGRRGDRLERGGQGAGRRALRLGERPDGHPAQPGRPPGRPVPQRRLGHCIGDGDAK
jgi:sialate O-acetylesterase